MQASFINWQGKMLGRYRLLRLLGKGSMGEVWLAEDIQLDRQVAVKMLPAIDAVNQAYLQTFQQEARKAASLEHPHIVPIQDFGEEKIAGDELILYLVMPYMAGGSLQKKLQSVQGSFPMGEGLRYLRQIAQAIDYAHGKQVLHQNIKPTNILLQREKLLVADFGIAKILNETKLRQTPTKAGTPEYMAPEQAQDHAKEASDLYSLAIIAYQMLTGSVPFKGKTSYDTLIQQMTASPDPLRNRQSSISSLVEEVVLKGLSKQETERQTSCAAFVNELERALQGRRHVFSPTKRVVSQGQGKTDPKTIALVPKKKPVQGLNPISLQPYHTSKVEAVPHQTIAQIEITGPQTVPAEAYHPSTWLNIDEINKKSYPIAEYGARQISRTGSLAEKSTHGTRGGIQNILAIRKSKIGRRELLIGGAAAIIAIGGGAILASRERSKK